jgi:hypothetical protein
VEQGQQAMKDKIIHQWRDWILEYVSEGKYALIQKETLAVRTIAAKDDMDAENQCQQIIRSKKESGVAEARRTEEG